MRRRRLLWPLLVAMVIVLGLWFALTQASLSALDEPGRAETYLARRAKRFLVGRSAREGVRPAPPNDAASLAAGRMLFGARCASCHGYDGRTPTDIGRAMYPRVLDLGSSEVQAWSDAELFWIIKNGIRLSGMPGFGKIHSDVETWHLVHYLRTLGTPPAR